MEHREGYNSIDQQGTTIQQVSRFQALEEDQIQWVLDWTKWKTPVLYTTPYKFFPLPGGGNCKNPETSVTNPLLEPEATTTTIPFELDLNKPIAATKEQLAMLVDHEFLQWMDRFDEFIKESQRMDKYRGIDYDDLCLFPDTQLLPKFKILDFAKYDSNGDPIVHLKMFCNLLGKLIDDPMIAIKLFGASLVGDSLK
ncbi:hypothetical protein ACH5RR_025740 [Cinchona calisaya]|uniref:Uncharacterized protein n=1 Tax=Cinchona calisaya TaxID=153742 RepID=A0ABD2Z1L8_9GENT